MKGFKVSIFELVMLVCFGAAWPLSIYKSYTTKNNSGKSLLFLFVILVGYASGIIHKLLHSRDIIIYAYGLNALLVTIDICLFFRNSHIEQEDSGINEFSGSLVEAEE